jgi:D-alanine-D-alanine ligase
MRRFGTFANYRPLNLRDVRGHSAGTALAQRTSVRKFISVLDVILIAPGPDRLMRPPQAPSTRILFLARHAPEPPDFSCKHYPGDGGYAAYYHRVWRVMTELGYPVVTTSQCRTLFGLTGTTVDLVFSLYNRMPIGNPEIFVASTCEFLGLPCVGAPPNIRALAEDKWLCKLAARALGLPVSEGAIYRSMEELAVPPAFAGPYFVKNRFGAASEGISEDSLQNDWAGASRVARRLLGRGMSVLVETYAPGVDVTVPVLGGPQPMMLGIVRPRSNRRGNIITEDLKRDDPLGYEMFDASPALREAIAGDVAALWSATGPVDYCRLDFRFDPATGRRVFLEFNICCHIGRSGAVCLAAAQWGLSQADVVGHVIEYSLHRQRVEPERRRWAQ